MTMNLSGWGRYPVIRAETFGFDDAVELARRVTGNGDLIPRGLGRSYGDSAVYDRAAITERYRRIISFDADSGELICESGLGLHEIIDTFLRRGWFLTVTPGTKFITVGGAIASDVHGKNHHKVGCFSECVSWFDLMLPDGSVVRCSRDENPELFRATCGGMGLTGVILTTAIRLAKVESANIRERIFRAANLSEIFALFDEHKNVTYSVAWIDCLKSGAGLGRSLLMVGETADDGKFWNPPGKKLTIPVDMPGFMLNRISVSVFNELYYHKSPKTPAEHIVHLDKFFYPLDAIHDWNKIYGRRGFTQYQFVLPKESAFEGLRTILTRISEAGLGSFLAVLKLFGNRNDNYLSFPMEGYTLALDFSIEPRLFPFLDDLDKVVLDCGGRLYLTKDVRMSPETFRKGYPMLDKFLEIREKHGLRDKFNSLQSKRLGV